MIHLHNTLETDCMNKADLPKAERLFQSNLDQAAKYIDGDCCERITTLHAKWIIKILTGKSQGNEHIAKKLIICFQTVSSYTCPKNVAGFLGLARSQTQLERFGEATRTLTEVLEARLNNAEPLSNNNCLARLSLAEAKTLQNYISEAIAASNRSSVLYS